MLLTTIKSANVALRFLLELCVLAALCDWGFQTGSGLIVKIGLGIGVPLLAALIWGTFGAPNAPMQVHDPLHLVLEVVVFGSAVVALYAAGHPSLAWALAFVVVLNRALIYVWAQ